MKCDICAIDIEDEQHVKSITAYETKFEKEKQIGWRRIMNKVCCDKCYYRIVHETGASGIF